MSRLDVAAIRKDFPFFESTDLIYLDNSATSQRPKVVLDAVNDYYYHFNANPFRGLYQLSIDSTEKYEHARHTVAQFINASSDREIIFTRNASESLNLVAYSLGNLLLKEGDEVNVKILDVKDGKISLSIKAVNEKDEDEVLEDAVDDAAEEYSDGSAPTTSLAGLLAGFKLPE